MSRYIAAIDLGTAKVVSIVGEVTPSGVKIIGYHQAPSQGIMRGDVVNIQKVIDSLNPTLEYVNEQINTMPDTTPRKIKDVYVGISGHNLKCIENTIHRNRDNSFNKQLISEDEVQTMIEEMFNTPVASTEQILHVIPQSYNVDEQIGCKEIVGMDGDSIDGKYKIFVGKTSSATHTRSVLNRANLSIKKMILSPIASAEAVLTEDEKELGVLMIDIGAGTSDVIIYYDHIIRHIAIIPFGGNAISMDIRQTCSVSFKNAELLKRQQGSCLSEQAPQNKHIGIKDKMGNITQEIPCKLLAATIEARVCEIIATALHELEKSGYKDKVKNIVITGGSSSLNHIQSLAKEISKMNVRLAMPGNQNILNTSLNDIYKPAAATAVGLILLGAADSKNEPQESELEFTNIWGEKTEDDPANATSGNNTNNPANGKKKKQEKKKGFKFSLSDIFKSTASDNEA